jgi:hypothetical protein
MAPLGVPERPVDSWCTWKQGLERKKAQPGLDWPGIVLRVECTSDTETGVAHKPR